MPTQILAESTAAGNSSDVTIASGGSVTFGLSQAAGGAIGYANAVVSRKNASGTYSPTGVYLTAGVPNQVIAAAGVYRVEKPATGQAIGVISD